MARSLRLSNKYRAFNESVMRIDRIVVDAIAHLPARLHTKLLLAFLAIAMTLVIFGILGLQILNGMNARSEELIALQRKIAAFQKVQHDTTRQLYGVSAALLSGERRALGGLLRQLNQVGYDLARMQLVETGEAELMADVVADYERFIEIVGRAVERAQANDPKAAQELQSHQAQRLVDRLERQTNKLVNLATANMLDRIAATEAAYRNSRNAVIGVALGSVALALLLGYVFSSAILRPLAQIKQRLSEIARGDFGGSVSVRSRDELGTLAEDVNRTSSELGQLYGKVEEQRAELADWNVSLQRRVDEQVAEIGRISRLRRFLSPQIADLVISEGSEDRLESHRGEVTVLFADLRGFTAFADQTEPETVMATLGAFHDLAGPLINKLEGTLERFLGDGIMVLFNDPVPCCDPEARALQLALELQGGFRAAVKPFQHTGEQLGLGIGIAHGMATMGRIGFEGRFDYAAIGTVANLAARLCDAAVDGQILMTSEVANAAAAMADTEPLGTMTFKGLQQPVPVHSVNGPA